MSPRLRLACAGLLLGMPLASSANAVACDPSWPRWQAFKQNFLSDDGRVRDPSSPRQHSVSEGQAYALFFALAADEPDTFERVLGWTQNNLAAGDISRQLPAWQWGRRDDNSWGVLDDNPAADADLWIAYALAEAARLWNVRRYRILAQVVAQRILAEEAADLPGLGLSVLPAPRGFIPAPGQWRLNPSYVPLQVLRRLALFEPRWQAALAPAAALLRASAPQGYAPEWTLYTAGHGFAPDVQTQGMGSYNAIRVYLWAGLLAADEPERAGLLRGLTPMAHFVVREGQPPEAIDILTGTYQAAGPPGFSAAVTPLLTALNQTAAAQEQWRRATTSAAEPRYYGDALTLFASGSVENRFTFDRDGNLQRQRICTSPHS